MTQKNNKHNIYNNEKDCTDSLTRPDGNHNDAKGSNRSTNPLTELNHPKVIINLLNIQSIMKQFAFITLMLMCSCWSNVFSQNNGNSLQHLYGDWQCDCLPMLSIGENCCSTVWNGVPVSSTNMLFENDTLHVLFLLTTQKNKTSYMEINIHATGNNANCLIEIYEAIGFNVYIQSTNRNNSITCKLSRDERQAS